MHGFSSLNLRTAALKDGFKTELENRKSAIQNCRIKLEGLYGIRVDDDELNKPEHSEHKGNIMTALRTTDTAFNALSGSIKSVKAVVESWSIYSTQKVSFVFWLCYPTPLKDICQYLPLSPFMFLPFLGLSGTSQAESEGEGESRTGSTTKWTASWRTSSGAATQVRATSNHMITC